MPALSVRNLTMTFIERNLFTDVSFDVEERDKVGFIGANGVGKTTLFKILNGEISPVSGTVTFSINVRPGYMEQDVYKRQVHGVHPGFLLFRYGGGLVHHCPVFRRCAPFLVIGKAVHFLCPTGGPFIDRVIVDGMHPVSYTHLDVYKRQSQYIPQSSSGL